MGAVGTAADNAMMESFWGRLQVKLLNRRRWKTRIELATAIHDYIVFHRGRDGHCWPPPAQIPACASNALGS